MIVQYFLRGRVRRQMSLFSPRRKLQVFAISCDAGKSHAGRGAAQAMRDFGQSQPVAAGEQAFHFVDSLDRGRLKKTNESAHHIFLVGTATRRGGQVAQVFELFYVEDRQPGG